MINIITTLMVSFLLFSCSSVSRIISEDEDANTYKSNDVGKLVSTLEGEIIAMRKVTMAGSKGVGAAVGAGIGGAAGNTVNDVPTDRAVAASIGATAGAVIGSLVEKSITERIGWEFVILLKSGEKKSFVQNTSQSLMVGDAVLIIQSPGQVRITRITN